MFESTTLDPFLEIANKLHDYVEAHSEGLKGGEGEERQKVIELIRKELEIGLIQLSTGQTE